MDYKEKRNWLVEQGLGGITPLTAHTIESLPVEWNRIFLLSAELKRSNEQMVITPAAESARNSELKQGLLKLAEEAKEGLDEIRERAAIKTEREAADREKYKTFSAEILQLADRILAEAKHSERLVMLANTLKAAV